MGDILVDIYLTIDSCIPLLSLNTIVVKYFTHGSYNIKMGQMF
jgi:hypothetical protein